MLAMRLSAPGRPMRIISDKSYISFFTPMKSMKFLDKAEMCFVDNNNLEQGPYFIASFAFIIPRTHLMLSAISSGIGIVL